MDAEFAWACGLFEGEDSMSPVIRGPRGCRSRRSATMQLGMVDLDVVERFRAAVGCGAIYPCARPPRRTIYRWQIGKAAEIVALDRMEPMLSPRRQQRAREVRASLNHPSRGASTSLTTPASIAILEA